MRNIVLLSYKSFFFLSIFNNTFILAENKQLNFEGAFLIQFK